MNTQARAQDPRESEHSFVAHHFHDMAQQREAALLGMWTFLVTEVLFFGGLFTVYGVYRWAHPEVFADVSGHLSIWLGGINTAVLLCSSLTMALAVRAAQVGGRKSLFWLLMATAGFGVIFLGVKGVEWYIDYQQHLIPGLDFRYHGQPEHLAEMFFVIYFCMTGLHGLHVVIGIVMLVVMAFMARRGSFPPERYMPVEIAGLYWHFVDIVWVFLFPLLYLIGGRQ
jgi:cytochrome c oxidase subunit III